MIKQATKLILVSAVALFFMPNAGIAQNKAEPNTFTDNDPSVSYNKYETQEDLVYVYSLYDEGLMNTKYIDQMDYSYNIIESNSKNSILMEYDDMHSEELLNAKERMNQF